MANGGRTTNTIKTSSDGTFVILLLYMCETLFRSFVVTENQDLKSSVIYFV